MHIKISNIFLGCSRYQCDGILKAFDEDTKENIGFLEYSENIGNIKRPSIKMIKVDNEFRLKGVGKSLILELQQQYPIEEIQWGLLTNDGYALKQSLQNDLFVDYNKIEMNHQLDELKKNSKNLDNQMKELISGKISDVEKDLLDILQSKQDDIEKNIYNIEKIL